VIAAIVAWLSRLLDAKAQQRPYWLDEPALTVSCVAKFEGRAA